MMTLVNYSDSDDDEEDEREEDGTKEPAIKKRRLSNGHSAELVPPPPPLPPSFHDLYSSTTRLSNSDDPSLHGGRKRVVPHVEGNWAAHVYLEWHPSPLETTLLNDLIAATKAGTSAQGHAGTVDVHSLLQDPLGVPLPLHISLSAPLILRTESKDEFLEAMIGSLQRAVAGLPATTATRNQHLPSSLGIKPMQLRWHANEDRSRAFLVLAVSDEQGALMKLLEASNAVAEKFGCSALYPADRSRAVASDCEGSHGESGRADHDGQGSASRGREGDRSGQRSGGSSGGYLDRFHISLAWSLNVDEVTKVDSNVDANIDQLIQDVKAMRISFAHVKVRLGKDVTSIPFSRAKSIAKPKGLFG